MNDYGNNRNISLHGVHLSDAGEYMCAATMSNSSVTSVIHVNVKNSLTISPLTVQDEGVYICTVTVNGESRNRCIIDASDKVWINVLSKLLSEHIWIVYYHFPLCTQLFQIYTCL